MNIVGSLIFSGVSGAALADVGGIGRIEIKAMKDEGFPVPFAAALTGASAIVGPIFPPSIPVIIYAAATSISAIQLLVAGIIPALVCVAMLMIATAIVSYRRGYPRSTRWPTFRELWTSFWPASPALFAPVVLVGGMLSGYFTPTEASAVCVAYILFIGIVVLSRDDAGGFIYRAAVDTVRTSAAVLIIVGAAAMFGWILAVEQVPQEFSAWFKDITTNPLMMLLIVNVIFFIAGMFVDSTTATLLLVPIVAPPVVAAGVDPIHLGMVVIFNLMIGTITPPFGLSLFLLSSMTGVSMIKLLRAMLPFYPPLLITLAILTLFPVRRAVDPDDDAMTACRPDLDRSRCPRRRGRADRVALAARGRDGAAARPDRRGPPAGRQPHRREAAVREAAGLAHAAARSLQGARRRGADRDPAQPRRDREPHRARARRATCSP